ncbi:MAG TPA: acetate--CoA ligase family protein [Nitrospirota bacterium]|nr:acetate--CoA ligase family protein [Nitrospirota bacterium]
MTNARSIIEKALQEGRKILFEHEAKALVHTAGVVVPRHVVVVPDDERAVVTAGEKLGFPLVLKAVSPAIVHKTEAGAVMVNITTSEALTDAIQSMKRIIAAQAPGAEIHAFLLEKMLPLGLEVLIGVVRDSQFGPSVSFGLGGIWVEAIKDVAFGILPMTHEEISDMIAQTRAALFLKGFRGTPPFDEEALHLIIANLTKLVDDHPEIRELELNPVRVYEHGAAALDARVILA